MQQFIKQKNHNKKLGIATLHQQVHIITINNITSSYKTQLNDCK